MKLFREYFYEMILSIISICLLILMVAPYWFGFKMQTNYENVLASLSENTSYTYEVVTYSRGWFSTDADLLVKDSDNTPVFYLKHKIIHGPLYLGLLLKGQSPVVSMVIKGEVISVANTNKTFFKLFDDSSRITLNAVIHSNDDAVVTLNVPDINKKIEDISYDFNNIKVKLKYFSESGQYQGEVTSDQIKIVGITPFEVSSLIVSFDQTLATNSLAGDLVVSFSELKTKLSDQMIDIRQFSTRLINNKSSDLLSLDLDANASVINVLNEQLNGLLFAAEITGVDYELIKNNVLAFFAEGNANEYFMFNDFYFFSALNVNSFDFVTEHGSFSSKLRLILGPLIDKSEKRYFMNVKPELNLSISNTLFRRIYEIVFDKNKLDTTEANKFVSSMIKYNYLEKNANKFQLRLSQKEGKFVVNDLLVGHDDFIENISSALFLK